VLIGNSVGSLACVIAAAGKIWFCCCLIFCKDNDYARLAFRYLWLALILLFCVLLQSESSRSLVRGLVLLNCAGGMNNKAIVDDWRIKLLFPLLWLFDFLLSQRGIASAIFERVRKRYPMYN